MAKSVLVELEKAMKERNIKIPALALLLDIPKDRMYKWYQQGTKPKLEDSIKIWDWINGEMNSVVEENQAEYGPLPPLLRIIDEQKELLTLTIKEKEETMRIAIIEKEETMRMLIKLLEQGGNKSKNASG